MPNTTKNYGLKKPLSEEFYDVQVQNENMDIIDEELKKKYDPSNKPTANDLGITPDKIGAAKASHTHNYAGSSSAGGAATSANKLNTNAGNTNTPVYFSNGVPVDCSTVSVTNGGTGATSADKACENIGAVKKSGDTMTGRLQLTSSDGYPTLPFHAVGSDSYAAAIQTNVSSGRMSFIERTQDTKYTESFQLPTPVAGLTENKYYNILTSKGGNVNGSLSINGANLNICNGIPTMNLFNADGSETITALQGVSNGSKSNYMARIGVKGKGTNCYEYFSTPVAANNLTEHKYYNFLTTKDPVTIANGGTGATSADKACENIGAIKKSGDTMTGALAATGLNIQTDAAYPKMMFLKSNGESRGHIQLSEGTRQITAFQFNADQDGKTTRYTEGYWLPKPDAGLTVNKNYNILTDKSPVTLAQGGTGATTADAACNNIGAVKKSGDTMTGNLNISTTYKPAVNLNADGQLRTKLFSNDDQSYRFTVESYAADQTNYPERFRLPAAAAGLTSTQTYDILTSKAAVTIAQGGTGAMDAATARKNLGLNTEAFASELESLIANGGMSTLQSAIQVTNTTLTDTNSTFTGTGKGKLFISSPNTISGILTIDGKSIGTGNARSTFEVEFLKSFSVKSSDTSGLHCTAVFY